MTLDNIKTNDCSKSGSLRKIILDDSLSFRSIVDLNTVPSSNYYFPFFNHQQFREG